MKTLPLALGQAGLVLTLLFIAVGSVFAETTKDAQAVVEKALAPLAAKFPSVPADREAREKVMKQYLQDNLVVYGIAFAPAPVAKGEDVPPSLYVYRHEGKLESKWLALPKYNYPADEWYTLLLKEGKPVWSHRYFDHGGGEIWMKTYSVPLYADAEKKQVFGVLTSDLPVPAPEKKPE